MNVKKYLLIVTCTTFIFALISAGIIFSNWLHSDWGGGINMPILNVLAVQTASRENRGKATSTYYAAFDVGSGIGAAVWGVVADMFGRPGAMVPGYRVVYAGAAVFYLITMGAAYLLIGRKEKQA